MEAETQTSQIWENHEQNVDLISRFWKKQQKSEFGTKIWNIEFNLTSFVSKIVQLVCHLEL